MYAWIAEASTARQNRALVLLLAVLIASPASTQAGDSAAGKTAASAVAAAFAAASAAVSFLPLAWPEEGGLAPWIANPLRLGAAVPMYWIDLRRALATRPRACCSPRPGCRS